MKKFLRLLVLLLIAIPAIGLLNLSKFLFKNSESKDSGLNLINKVQADIPVVGNGDLSGGGGGDACGGACGATMCSAACGGCQGPQGDPAYGGYAMSDPNAGGPSGSPSDSDSGYGCDGTSF